MIPARRQFRWCVTREVWENRSLYWAPAIVAVIVLLGFTYQAWNLPARLPALLQLAGPVRDSRLVMPYAFAAMAILTTTILVGWYYALDALQGERRDRSILFWKSLPVSDHVTVLAKAAVPLVVLPVIAAGVILVLQLAMLIAVSAIFLVKGANPGQLWSLLPLVDMPVGVVWSVLATALWHAPIVALLLLVSVSVPRAPVLFVLLPLVAAMAIEYMAMGFSPVYTFVADRVGGASARAFTIRPFDPPIVTPKGQMPPIPDMFPDPLKFFSTPDVWIGLAAAAALVYAAIVMRRRREPS